MPQITFNELSVSFSDRPVLDAVNATIHKGDKIALVGRNGEGKSTLMRIIANIIEPNEGEIKIKNNIIISYLEQTLPLDNELNLFSVVALGLGENGQIIANYHNAINIGNMNLAEQLQVQIERLGIWDSIYQVNTLLTKFGLEANALLKTLSSGWRRRLMLAKALINNPDVLLLDEPTNHMDINAILLLEKMLQSMTITMVLISHDRHFITNIVNKVFDLDRGKLSVFDCGYQQYVKRKDDVLNAQALENARFDKKLAQEEIWIRQGIKARRTRNEGRVRALEAMRDTYQNRRTTQGKATIHLLDEEKRVSKLVFEVKNISYNIGDKQLITAFSSIVLKGDKIGIIGGNGVGKSTFIKLLLGELTPSSGNIRRSKTLKLAYFDQVHEFLEPKMKVADFVSDGKERIEINGKSKHIIGYLRNFLFTGKQALAPIKMLSGGEKNRLMLAKILSKPANLLVLDEPTNDLDVETLELLEEMLSDYQGTLIIISHDRAFLNNVVSSTIVMDGDSIVQYAGGYDDYLSVTKQKNAKPKALKTKIKNNGKKLNYKQQQLLKKLPNQIETLEKTIADLTLETTQENFYQQEDYQQKLKNLKTLGNELDILYQKWSKLE